MKAAKKFKDVAFAEKMAEICFATSEADPIRDT